MGDADELYEDDEPVERVLAIFDSGDKGVTGQVRGWNATLDVPGPAQPFRASSTSVSGNVVAH